MDVFPFKRKMHIVFLRNVMIYFDKETKKQLVQKVYDVLEPGGYLFIGRTETIERSDSGFELIQPSIFQKIGAKTLRNGGKYASDTSIGSGGFPSI